MNRVATHRRWGSILAAGLAAAALLAGTLLRHVDFASHDVPHGSTTIYVADCDRAPSAHLDATRAVELPDCPACLAQLVSLGDANSLPLQATGLSRLAVVPQRNDTAPRNAAYGFDSARAPPRA